MLKLLRRLQRSTARVRYLYKRVRRADQKIFVIGKNKTGTTSMMVLFEELGYIVGDQATAESLIRDYANGDYRRLLEYCDSAEVFQDAPFSWPDTYRHLYEKYPDAKYILTERDTAEQWFNSLVSYHQKIVGCAGRPTVKDLKECKYRWSGFLWEAQQAVYGATEETLYDELLYTGNYKNHCESIKTFFSNKENFLAINLANEKAADRLAGFLDIDPETFVIPHVNKT